MFIKETAEKTIEELKDDRCFGRLYEFNRDLLFHIAAKNRRSKAIVWSVIRSNNISVLRAHGKPNIYGTFVDKRRNKTK